MGRDARRKYVTGQSIAQKIRSVGATAARPAWWSLSTRPRRIGASFKPPRADAEAVEPTAGAEELILAAISLGSVFGGAMTYIGNGPNLMVKAIAEKSGVKMPSLFGYMMYSGVIPLPILALTCWLFLVK